MNYRDICDKIMEYERECGKLMLHAGRIMPKEKTGRRDVVTQFDRQIQDILTEKFTALIPGAGFFSEEQEDRDNLNGEHVFIIDPIDGTMNFVHHMNMSCISVAYASFGEICAAAVYNPYADEMFSAVKGEGAFLNGEKVHIDDCALQDSLCLFGTSPYRNDLLDRTFALARVLVEKSLDLRRSGSAELDISTVGAGRAGLFFELSLSLWDYAAGMLIVREAGGYVCTADGEPLPLDGQTHSVAAGGERQVKEFLELAEKIR